MRTWIVLGLRDAREQSARFPVTPPIRAYWREAMPVDGAREVFRERNRGRDEVGGSWFALLVVLGVLAAVAFGWWAVGITPPAQQRMSQAPPSVTSPDTTVQPRTTVPEGGSNPT